MSENTVVLEEKISALEAAVADLTQAAQELAAGAGAAAVDSGVVEAVAHGAGGHDFFMNALTVFVLALFVGYYVVWHVTPALHSPLMGVTNAISSVIIVGGLIAAGASESWVSQFFAFLAVTLASVNIFGGFLVTERMLSMFKKKEKPAKKAA